MVTGVLLTVGSFFYTIVLAIVYFRKSKIDTLENKIFKRIIISNLFGLSLHLLLFLLMFYIGTESILTLIFTKLYLVYLISYMVLFTFYVFSISSNKRDIIELEFKKYILYVVMVILFVAFFIFILPVQFYNEPGKMYSYGMSVQLVYYFGFVMIFLNSITLIKNFKQALNKKYYPLLFYFGLGLVTTLIQYKFPYIQLITSKDSFIIFIMYFTIENPDLKMLEEVTKIKEITEKTNEDKSSFLYHVTDEMNLVLNNVKTKLDNINKMDDVSEIKSSLREISAIVNNSKKRVNASINISEMDSKELKVIYNTYNIVNLLNGIVAYNRNKIKNNIDFRYDISNTIPDMLYGDSIKVKQIINSVIDNSIKNTNEGFIELRVSCIVKYDICRLIISVEDSGTGIDLVKQNKILRDNSDLDVNEIKGKDNLIVNLKTVNKLINIIGGTLSIESLNNNGTTINITLDQKIVQRDGSTLDEKLDTYNKYMSDKKIIGIISENKDNVKVIKQIGKKNNYNVESFEMTKTCLDKIRDGEVFDTIVIDEDMDKIDARSFLDKVRKVESFKGKVFVITKKKSIQLKKELKDYGFDAILIEPLNKKDVEVNFK